MLAVFTNGSLKGGGKECKIHSVKDGVAGRRGYTGNRSIIEVVYESPFSAGFSGKGEAVHHLLARSDLDI